MAQVVAKFPPRAVDNHSIGVADFEPLLNSHQAAKLLDIHRARYAEDKSTYSPGRAT